MDPPWKDNYVDFGERGQTERTRRFVSTCGAIGTASGTLSGPGRGPGRPGGLLLSRPDARGSLRPMS